MEGHSPRYGEAPYNTEADLAAGLAASSRRKRGNREGDRTRAGLGSQIKPSLISAPTANTIVYVDGFNLYYGALRRTPYRWLDLGALCRLMLPTDNIVAINYYTALVSARPGNPSAATDQQIYLRALRTVRGLTITLGHFLTHSVQMSLSGVIPTQRVWVDKTEEKGSDVNIAAHMIRDACLKRFDVAALITNDSDLAEPVRIVRAEVNSRGLDRPTQSGRNADRVNLIGLAPLRGSIGVCARKRINSSGDSGAPRSPKPQAG